MGSELFKDFIRKSILYKQTAPGPPPRQGLQWKPQTRRWIRPKTPSAIAPSITIPTVRAPSGRASEDILSRVKSTPTTIEIDDPYSIKDRKKTIQYSGTPSPWVGNNEYTHKGSNSYNSRSSPIAVNKSVIQDHVSDLADRILDSGKIKYTGDRQKLKEDLRREIIPSEILDDLGIDQIPDFEKKHDGITQDANTHLSDITNLQIEDFIVSYTGIPEFDPAKSIIPENERKINKAFKTVIKNAVKNHDEDKIPLETLKHWRGWSKWDPKYQRVLDDLLYNTTARSAEMEGPDSSFSERVPIASQKWVLTDIVEELGFNLFEEPAHEMRAIEHLQNEYLEDAGSEFALHQSKKMREFIEEKYPTPFNPANNSDYEQHSSVPRTERNPMGWRRKDGEPIIQFDWLKGVQHYQLARNSSEEEKKVTK